MSGGDGRNMSGEFPLWLRYGDVEMMYDIMQHGLTRMMFGGEKNSKESIARFKEIFDQLKAMSPLPVEARNRGESSFFDAFRAVETCDAFEIVVEKRDRQLDEAVISVLVQECGEMARFDLTHWLKVPVDAKGRKDARPLDEIFSDNIGRLSDMLVEVSPVAASRIVEFTVRIQVPGSDWTWGDDLRATMQAICCESFGEQVEYRGYDFQSRSEEGFPGFIDLDVVVAAPSTLDGFLRVAARRRTDAILEGQRLPHAQ
jgi:hypothetical protein